MVTNPLPGSFSNQENGLWSQERGLEVDTTPRHSITKCHTPIYSSKGPFTFPKTLLSPRGLQLLFPALI